MKLPTYFEEGFEKVDFKKKEGDRNLNSRFYGINHILKIKVTIDLNL